MVNASETVAVPSPPQLNPENLFPVLDAVATAGKLMTLAVLDKTPDDFVSSSEMWHRLDAAQGPRPGWPFRESKTVPRTHCSTILQAAGLVEIGTTEGKGGSVWAARITPRGSELWPAIAGAYLPWSERHPQFRLIEVIGRHQTLDGASARVGMLEQLLKTPDVPISMRQIKQELGVSFGTVTSTVRELSRAGLVEREYNIGPEKREFTLSQPSDNFQHYLWRLSPGARAAVRGLLALWEEGITEVDGLTIVRKAAELDPQLDPKKVWKQFINWSRQPEQFVTAKAFADNPRQRTKVRVAPDCVQPLAELVDLRTRLATDPDFRASAAKIGHRLMRSTRRVAAILGKARHNFADQTEWELALYQHVPPGGSLLETLYDEMQMTYPRMQQRSMRRRLSDVWDILRLSSVRAQEGVTAVGYVSLKEHRFPRNWFQQALCQTRESYLELFNPPESDPPAVQDAKMTEAVALCRRCPVRLACLAAAVGNNESTGVWGGLTPLQIQGLSPQQRTSILNSVRID